VVIRISLKPAAVNDVRLEPLQAGAQADTVFQLQACKICNSSNIRIEMLKISFDHLRVAHSRLEEAVIGLMDIQILGHGTEIKHTLKINSPVLKPK
jgi:hypothetical protein